MKNEEHRTLKNFFLIPLGISIIAILTWLFYLYIEGRSNLNPNPDARMGAGGEVFAILYFFGLLVFLFIIFLTIRIVLDVVKNRKNKKFILDNISILLFVYSPFLLFGTYKIYSETSFLLHKYYYSNEQKKNIINIEYKIIGLDNNEAVFAYHNKNDSLFIFINHHSKVQKDYRKLFPTPSYPCSQLWLEDLRIVYIKGKQLIPFNNYNLDTISENNAGRNIYLKIPEWDNKSNVVSKFLYNKKTTELFIKNAGRNGRLDTVRGFDLEDKFHGFQFQSHYSYIDSNGNLWFYFYEKRKDTTEKPSYMYIAMVGNKEKKFYKIIFKEGENDFFDGDKKLFMTKVNGIFYLIARQKIIAFPIE